MLRNWLKCDLISLVLACPTECDQNARQEGFFTPYAQVNMMIQDKFLKSKSSSHFPNFDASNGWQMGHNSEQGFFLSKNWLRTPRTCSYICCVGSYRTHFASLKRVGDLWVYQGFMTPINHQTGYKVLKNNP